MKRKGSVWISAALYFGLGIVVLSIIIAAGTPVINKLRDKNVAIQTKEVFFKLDNNIREVARGGPGTQRLLHVEIKKGDLSFTEEGASWTYQTKALLSEPMPQGGDEADYIINEGNLEILTKQTSGSKYDLRISLDYEELEIIPEVLTAKGATDLIIKNEGDTNDNNKVEIKISER